MAFSRSIQQSVYKLCNQFIIWLLCLKLRTAKLLPAFWRRTDEYSCSISNPPSVRNHFPMARIIQRFNRRHSPRELMARVRCSVSIMLCYKNNKNVLKHYRREQKSDNKVFRRTLTFSNPKGDLHFIAVFVIWQLYTHYLFS